MKQSIKENPEIVPAPQIMPVGPTPQTNPVKRIRPEIKPGTETVQPMPKMPEIKRDTEAGGI
jgi:hypothetical protein